MTNKEIQDLVKLMGKTDLAELKLKDGEFELLLRTNEYFKNKKTQQIVSSAPQAAPVIPMTPAASQSVSATQAPSSHQVEVPLQDTSTQTNDSEPTENSTNHVEVKSPIVGTFYRSPSPDKAPFVKVGDKIEKGDVVCIVEAMKLFNEIESEVSGTIVKVLIEDASPVEYDQPLFLVDPS
jgi:acetyl-CoA carboxylase biotin carboxyl carrier protein